MTEVVTSCLYHDGLTTLALESFGTICSSAHMYCMGTAWSACGPQQSALVCIFFTRGNTSASVPAGSCHVAYHSGYTSALSAP